MRNNEPITNCEVELANGQLLVSRTDPGGRITFVNQAFVAISGFSEQELIGAPHNIVRHPHMPTAAFADLWATIKAGKPWEGLVKNRAKTGDFYWVRANITPIVENGAIAGYISIRSKPTRAQIDEAERLYSIMRDSTASGITIREGEVRNLGWRHWIGRTAQSVAGRLTAAFSALILLSLAAGWLGLDGMADSNESLRTVYEDRTVTAGQIGEIADRMRDNLHRVSMMVIDLQDGGDNSGIAGHEIAVRTNIERMTQVWKEYLATYPGLCTSGQESGTGTLGIKDLLSK